MRFMQHYLTEEKLLKLFHGTTKKNLPKIKRKGIVSSVGYDNASWYMLATDFESALFHSNADKNNPAVVIEIDIPIEDVKRRWFGYPYLWPPFERDNGEKWFALKQPIDKKYITKIHVVSYEDFLKQKNKGF